MLNISYEGLVGAGAYGKVYRGRTRKNRMVAVKVLPRTALDQDKINLITTEIELLKIRILKQKKVQKSAKKIHF